MRAVRFPRRAVALLCLYAATFAAPTAHHIWAATAAAAVPCLICEQAGPFLTADCAGTCNDPTHHHHLPHHAHHCPLCRAVQMSYAFSTQAQPLGETLAVASSLAWTSPAVPSCATLGPDAARAPPRLVAL